MKQAGLLLALIVLSVLSLHAQTFMNIRNYNGTGQYSVTSGIRKVTFNKKGNVMQVQLASGGVVSDSTFAIRKITFDNNGYGTILPVGNEYKSVDVKYDLSQNYPNPFNPSTQISYSIAAYGKVTLKVFDVLGKEVATLVNQEKPAGQYSVKFDVGNIASGLYFYKLSAGSVSLVKKMLVLK